MARTYRRKKSQWEFKKWHNHDWVGEISKYGGTYLKEVPNEGLEAKKAWSHYHGDRNKWNKGVPSWYTNLVFQRKFRMSHKQLIHKWSRNPEVELVFQKFQRSIGYIWY